MGGLAATTTSASTRSAAKRLTPVPYGYYQDLTDMAEVEIAAAESVLLPGTLDLPDAATGIVIFAHGSGSSRLSPRNMEVAKYLNAEGLATLLFDLLTPAEADDRRNVFDIELLGRRLVAATEWTGRREDLARLAIGYFGASTGAAAALVAAAELGSGVKAVVSRGGRPDLAIPVLHRVTAPTLLIVGGNDHPVIGMNEEAQQHLRCENSLVIVPGATHLFEEPGAIEKVSELASAWFVRNLRAGPSDQPRGGEG
jgi:putative phosphoribosyl transferase